jgi:hypothetical protein
VVDANSPLARPSCFALRLIIQDHAYGLLIDDQVPFDARMREHVGCAITSTFSSAAAAEADVHDPVYWPALVEKGFAKLAGSYGALAARLCPSEALRLFVGGSRSVVPMATMSSDVLWNRVAAALAPDQTNWAMVVCTDTGGGRSDRDVDQFGITQCHAYAVLGGVTIGGERLVRVRNPRIDEPNPQQPPQQRPGWRGPWCGADATRWSGNIALKELCRRNANGVEPSQLSQAEFWISVEHLRSVFKTFAFVRGYRPAALEQLALGKPLTASVVQGAWRESLGGATSAANPQIHLHVPVPVPAPAPSGRAGTAAPPPTSRFAVDLTLERDNDSCGLGLCIHRATVSGVDGASGERTVTPHLGSASQTVSTGAVFTSIFQHSDTVSGEAELAPGDYIIILYQERPCDTARFLLRLDRAPVGTTIALLPSFQLLRAPVTFAAGRSGWAQRHLGPHVYLRLDAPTPVQMSLVAPAQFDWLRRWVHNPLQRYMGRTKRSLQRTATGRAALQSAIVASKLTGVAMGWLGAAGRATLAMMPSNVRTLLGEAAGSPAAAPNGTDATMVTLRRLSTPEELVRFGRPSAFSEPWPAVKPEQDGSEIVARSTLLAVGVGCPTLHLPSLPAGTYVALATKLHEIPATSRERMNRVLEVVLMDGSVGATVVAV